MVDRWRDELRNCSVGAAAADSGQVVTPASLYSGLIPLRAVVGGSPLETGLGDLGGAIPVTLDEFFNMLLAHMSPTS